MQKRTLVSIKVESFAATHYVKIPVKTLGILIRILKILPGGRRCFIESGTIPESLANDSLAPIPLIWVIIT